MGLGVVALGSWATAETMRQQTFASSFATENCSKPMSSFLQFRRARTSAAVALDVRHGRYRQGECNDQRSMTPYCRPSWRSASLDTPETVPVNWPITAKKTGVFKAS